MNIATKPFEKTNGQAATAARLNPSNLEMRLGRALIDSDECVILVDPAGRLIWANPLGRWLMECARVPVGGNWLRLWCDEDGSRASDALEKALRDGAARFRSWNPVEFPVRKCWDTALSAVRNEQGRVDALLISARDVTPMSRTEQELRERVMQLDAIIANEPECVKVVGPGGELLEMNPAGLVMLEADSLEQARQRPLIDYVAPQYRDAFRQLHHRVLAGENLQMQFQLTGLRGTVRWLETHATPMRRTDGTVVGIVGVTRDITERRRLEEQAYHTQRLEGIGMLAAGIAHDLNNVLAPIMMAAPMLADHVVEAGGQQILNVMQQSAERGAGLVRQILAFAHQTAEINQRVDLAGLIRDLGNVIRETFPRNISFEERLAEKLPLIEGNPIQIQQVLLNLCVNARDALGHGGTIQVRAGRRSLDKAGVARIPGAREGSFVVIEVEDSGTGISPEIVARIWEPFYTTKGPGHGTGLGLPTVRGIVERHQGFVTLESTVGRGSCFSVWLPIAEETWRPETSAPLLPARAGGNGEQIVVVDDEVSIRDLAMVSLRRHGYRVIAAAGVREAREILADPGVPVDLLITDLHMAGGDGWELVDFARQSRPDIRLLVMSGASGDPPSRTGLAAQDIAFLPKPFSIDQLWKRVDTLLSGGSDGRRAEAMANGVKSKVLCAD